jgi:hypothetical protein
MNDVWSFVDDVQSLPEKMTQLEEIIDKILKQTVECAIFIREYTGHGFGGWLLTGHYRPMVADWLARQGRDPDVIWQQPEDIGAFTSSDRAQGVI